ncbi:MAG: endonuclease [Bacteroidales bacterium]|nr:endonuclease [Bacteroidales bacterium]
MKTPLALPLLAGMLLVAVFAAQPQSSRLPSAGVSCERLVFYNTENFFDAVHDSLKNDYDYLPQGSCHWTYLRYRLKAHRIAQALAAAGGERLPALIGLAEVENAGVVETLLREFHEPDYRYIHFESPDERGIDVSLIYDRRCYRLLRAWAVPVRLGLDGSGPHRPTRDILYACFQSPGGEDLHVYVCHWPSRYGGARISEERRCQAAAVLKGQVDSLFVSDPRARIVIMGDLNDEPSDKSVAEVLQAQPDKAPLHPGRLYDMMYSRAREEGLKSHKYQGVWSMLDHFIVSSSLYARPGLSAGVTADDFLLERDGKYLGLQPRRTIIGRSYHGGYSDHLPVWLDLPRND